MSWPLTRSIVVTSAAEVEILTINRPEVRNALRFQTYDELEHAVRTTTARCLVITGADPAFCSGDDVRQSWAAARSAPRGGSADAPADAGGRRALYTDVPVIAAVNGAAVGWGMELALMADIRVASEQAKFGELFVLRGLCTDVAGIGRLASSSAGSGPPSCCSPARSSTPPGARDRSRQSGRPP